MKFLIYEAVVRDLRTMRGGQSAYFLNWIDQPGAAEKGHRLVS
jgi:hypothetical protein